jgi:hypothetical protein
MSGGFSRRILGTQIASEPQYVRYWPKADMAENAIDVAIEGKADMGWCNANVCF